MYVMNKCPHYREHQYQVGPHFAFRMDLILHRFDKVMEIFLKDFGPYGHESMAVVFKLCSVGTKKPRKYPPHHGTTKQHTELLIQGRMDQCFPVYAKF